VVCSPAAAAPSSKKAIWGPVSVGEASQFPIYRDLRAGIFQTTLSWARIAPTRPANPDSPRDPAYEWPSELDVAAREARPLGMKLSVLLTDSPAWANGGRSSEWAPRRARDFARFAAAAARRYPAVRYWQIWGEPSKAERFQPLVGAFGRKLSERQRRGPRLYARILDASYAALKHVAPHDVVVGGNTWTAGDVVPLNFIRAMRLPSGRRPRMDMYGHNPFTARTPDLSEDPLAYGYADFCDLDTLAGWLDRYGYRGSRGRPLPLFLSEFTIPTDHPNWQFNFWVPARTQASWIAAAYRIARRWHRIHTLGYLGLYDDPPRPSGDEVNRGLLDWEGHRKPGYFAYRRG